MAEDKQYLKYNNKICRGMTVALVAIGGLGIYRSLEESNFLLGATSSYLFIDNLVGVLKNEYHPISTRALHKSGIFDKLSSSTDKIVEKYMRY